MALPSTKLHMPAPRRRLLERPRLLERSRPGDRGVSAAPLPRLILVAAPAGFGKTTLLTQLLDQWRDGGTDQRRRVAWLSLDAADDDPQRFLLGVVEAIQAAGSRAGETARDLLRTGSGTPSAIITTVIDDLIRLEEPVVLALDDYHLIVAPQVHDAVTQFLDRVPPHVSLALTTRADPPIPVSRWRARGDLLEIRAHDLRFTESEAGAFLREIMNVELDDGAVGTLVTRTEGWAAGLQLAALSLQANADPAAFLHDFSGSHRFVLDYLVEEVLDSQEAPIRSFLVDTAVLDRLSGPLCNALTGHEDGSSVLELLDRRNLFVVPLDESRQWYRYHQLFADTLRARLAADHPDRVAGLNRRAAVWLAGQGRVEEAIPYALRSSDADLAADLIQQGVAEVSRRREDRTISGWLTALPDEVVRRRPLLAVVAAWVRLGAGDVDDAASRLDDAERALATQPAADHDTTRDDDLRRLLATIAMYRAAVAQARGDTQGTATQGRLVLERAGPGDHFLRGAGGGFLGLAQWAAGDLDAAVDTFTDAVRSLHAAGNLTDELGGTVVLAGLCLARGNPNESEGLYADALAAAAQQPAVALPVTGDLHVGLADALRERGALLAARQHLDRARELGDLGSLPENRHRWFVVAAGAAQAGGDLDAAAALLDQAETLYLPGFFPEVRPIPALRARVDIARGRLPLARAWARQHPVDTMSYLSEYAHLTLARLLIAENRVDDAATALERLLVAASDVGRRGSMIEISMVQALAHQARGDVDAAVTALTTAIQLAVPNGYLRLFLDEGPAMTSMLQEVQRRRPSDALVQKLLSHPGETPAVSEPGTELLSPRELEVLRLLATELTGPEIAGRLYVSVNTLRTHTKHIFTKLDVSTRNAAVRRAAELGLL